MALSLASVSQWSRDCLTIAWALLLSLDYSDGLLLLASPITLRFISHELEAISEEQHKIHDHTHNSKGATNDVQYEADSAVV